MEISVTPLRRPIADPEPGRGGRRDAGAGPLARARDLVLELIADAGPVPFQDLCFYRFDRPTTFSKAATFGVTLGVVLQGTKRIRLGGAELEVDASRLLVITRETEHEAAAIDATPQRPFLGLGLCFCPERVARALLALVDAGGPTAQESVPAFMMPCDDELAGALERLLRAQADPLDRKLLAPLVIDEILYRLLRSDAAAAVRGGVAHGADARRILESMQFIRERHTDKLTVEALARKAAMSPSHFAHRFSSVARISPMRYVREVRLERARTLLLGNGARAQEVAARVGFESAAHFTREFKRRFGVPPSYYLRTRTPA